MKSKLLTIALFSMGYMAQVYAGQPEPLRKTWTINAPSKDAPLKAYGLLGPVRIEKMNE